MYTNISYKLHGIPDRQSRFITKVHDLQGQPSYLSKKVRCIEGHSDDQIVRGRFSLALARPIGFTCWISFALVFSFMYC